MRLLLGSRELLVLVTTISGHRIFGKRYLIRERDGDKVKYQLDTIQLDDRIYDYIFAQRNKKWKRIG